MLSKNEKHILSLLKITYSVEQITNSPVEEFCLKLRIYSILLYNIKFSADNYSEWEGI